MILDKINSVYFLGIGGIGMSALARFFLLQKKQVYGYDLTPTEITAQLMDEGAQIHFDEAPNKIPPLIDLAVYTPAIPKNHQEYQYFIDNNIPLLKRSEVLGLICNNYPTIAVAGTHGKTTTTAVLTQILNNPTELQIPPNNNTHYSLLTTHYSRILAFIGGISKNLNSNFVCEPEFDTVVVEADEFDRSFLTLHPQVAIITSIDADHLDIYGNLEHLITSFQLFANQIQPDGTLVIYDEIAHQITHPLKITYGFSDKTHYQITNIKYHPVKTTFSLTINHLPLTTNHLSLIVNLPGKHNVLNAVAALAACLEFSLWKCGKEDLALSLPTYIENLTRFSGVKRRFDIRIQQDNFVYIDDYAHHPEEIRAFLDAVKKSYPTKTITGIFQPHLYSRTRDFAQEFADALEVLDEIILLPIYPAREKPIEGITSDYLLSFIKNSNKKLFTKEELITYLPKNKPEVLVTMGAGDIDKMVKEIETILFLQPL
ncbi:MAG: UDP-N-acetylmuramate--L-alanine ligase [Bacteroidales bacterium]|jgi:UDP-N-acetylmuramate--alanine ligase|nr:UDP-N-acetylmuramate--L-alanine ligase [Bacteroidales bacterium]